MSNVIDFYKKQDNLSRQAGVILLEAIKIQEASLKLLIAAIKPRNDFLGIK